MNDKSRAPLEDFAHLAELLRESASNERALRALLSNNVSTILEALDVACRASVGTDRSGEDRTVNDHQAQSPAGPVFEGTDTTLLRLLADATEKLQLISGATSDELVETCCNNAKREIRKAMRIAIGSR